MGFKESGPSASAEETDPVLDPEPETETESAPERKPPLRGFRKALAIGVAFFALGSGQTAEAPGTHAGPERDIAGTERIATPDFARPVTIEEMQRATWESGYERVFIQTNLDLPDVFHELPPGTEVAGRIDIPEALLTEGVTDVTVDHTHPQETTMLAQNHIELSGGRGTATAYNAEKRYVEPPSMSDAIALTTMSELLAERHVGLNFGVYDARYQWTLQLGEHHEPVTRFYEMQTKIKETISAVIMPNKEALKDAGVLEGDPEGLVERMTESEDHGIQNLGKQLQADLDRIMKRYERELRLFTEIEEARLEVATRSIDEDTTEAQLQAAIRAYERALHAAGMTTQRKEYARPDVKHR